MKSTSLEQPPLHLPQQRTPAPSWVWRIAVALAVVAVVVAAALTVVGRRAESDVAITVGFAMGPLAAPLWLRSSR